MTSTEATQIAAQPRPVPGLGTLRLGTRRSRLATTQSSWVADLLRARGHEVALVEIATEGDVNRAPLTQIGGTGVFASALRDALREGQVDLAVHSLKDLPSAPEPGLFIAAVPQREDPRDALCARDGLRLEQLPAGARVGTGSPRRAAQLAARRPDLTIVPIRGNVETRLRRVGDAATHTDATTTTDTATSTDAAATESGPLDAIVLAYAGLRRLGLTEHVTQVLEPDVMLPAAGQGALAVECRADRTDLVETLRDLDDPPTRAAVEAERALLATLEAGCTAPIGALARPDGQTGLLLEAFVGADLPAGAGRDQLSGAAADPVGLGAALARRLLADAPIAGIAASTTAGTTAGTTGGTETVSTSTENDRSTSTNSTEKAQLNT